MGVAYAPLKLPDPPALAIIYVDGENHFIRSERCCKKAFGEGIRLDQIISRHEKAAPKGFPEKSERILLLEKKCRFFWDSWLAHWARDSYGLRYMVNSGVYFTSFSGSDDDLHGMRVTVRQFGFEPVILKEPAQLAKQRSNTLDQEKLIEKPKGVDIGLSVRMLEDAYRNVYQECLLFTSDVDYIPVIEAVQRLGKRVFVFGYRDGLSRHSELEYKPDLFIDLGWWMQNNYVVKIT